MKNRSINFILLLTFLGFSLSYFPVQDIATVNDNNNIQKKYLLGQVNAGNDKLFT